MKKVLALAWGMALILAVLLACVRFWALDRAYYVRFYQTHEVQADADLAMPAMDMMLDYVRGTTDSMDGALPGLGEVYNAREKAHMQDVRALFQSAMKVNGICWGLSAAGLAFCIWKKDWVLFALGFLRGALVWLVFMAFLGLWMATGFGDFWMHFHQLFFTNDLWLLDPATDFMIRICPEALFSGLVLRIVFSFGLCVSALSAGAWAILRKNHGTQWFFR